MPATRLHVRANDELILDAGSYEPTVGEHGPELLISPPETTLFRQVLAYLDGKKDPPGRLPGSAIGREGVAAAAATLRWGSYLAVLLDRDKPVWSAAHSEGTSRISDGEMARINIESSAALAEWIDLRRASGGGPDYTRLVDRAVSYLVMPQRTARTERGPLIAFANADLCSQLLGAIDPVRVARARGDAEQHATRLFTNAIVNFAWRNGPIERVHGGKGTGYPIGLRRVTLNEERDLMRAVSGKLAQGLLLHEVLEAEHPRRPWPEQVLPMGFVPLIGPVGWTLTETSRDVRLPIDPGILT